MHETPFFRIRNSQVLNATFSKKSHFFGTFLGISPIWAHFACKAHVGQKLWKTAFFEPKNRGMQKNLSTAADLCSQTPVGTTGRPKTPFLVDFWRFWPFSGFFACKSAILAVLAIFGHSDFPQIFGSVANSEKKISGLFDPWMVGDRYKTYFPAQRAWSGAASWRVCPPKSNSEKVRSCHGQFN